MTARVISSIAGMRADSYGKNLGKYLPTRAILLLAFVDLADNRLRTARDIMSLELESPMRMVMR